MATVQEALDQKRKEAAEKEAAAAQEMNQEEEAKARQEREILAKAAADQKWKDDQKQQQEEAQQRLEQEQKEQQQKQKEQQEKEQAERLEASRKEQDEQDKKDELQARLAAAQELLAENGVIPATISPVTPNAGNNPTPVPTLTTLADGTLLKVETPSQTVLSGAMRTFQHQYANASVITDKGKRLVFGGQNGGIGYYTTNKPAEIELLSEVADTPGSMVTEVKQAADGRYLVKDDPILQAERLAVQRDSRANTAADLDPNVNNARQNLGKNIAANS